jgi:hypothetical protein
MGGLCTKNHTQCCNWGPESHEELSSPVKFSGVFLYHLTIIFIVALSVPERLLAGHRLHRNEVPLGL